MRFSSGKRTYELVDWARLPPGLSFVDVGEIAIDASDHVYVLNRSESPVMVFDRDGNLLKRWGDGFFNRARAGCGVTADGQVRCTDDRNHVVAKFDPDGRLLAQLGTKGQPSDSGYGAHLGLLGKPRQGGPRSPAVGPSRRRRRQLER